MSQFDQTTEKKAEEFTELAVRVNCKYTPEAQKEDYGFGISHGFKNGRNSTKASMEILARAAAEIEELDSDPFNHHKDASKCAICKMKEAIAQVKANGDWPLEEE